MCVFFVYTTVCVIYIPTDIDDIMNDADDDVAPPKSAPGGGGGSKPAAGKAAAKKTTAVRGKVRYKLCDDSVDNCQTMPYCMCCMCICKLFKRLAFRGRC